MNILPDLIRVAKGEVRADLLLRGGKIVNVHSGEIYEANVAIYQDYVVGIGDYEAAEEVDLHGLYLAPGFIDGHIHIESSMVEVPQFARAVVPLGTTSVVADPHEIANVLGYDGIRYMLESSKYNPLNVFFMLPSCVPASNLETSGSILRAFDIYPFLREKWVLGLGEVMDYAGVLAGNRDTLDKMKISMDKRLEGHAPGLTGKDLCAYISTGISSDHECTTVEEAREKLRLGMHILIREGTATKNLKDLLPLVTEQNKHRFFFCTDDRHPSDLIVEGHMNYIIRTAIREGLEPVTAIQLATINTAQYFGLKRFGAIAPGYFADMVAFDNFEDFNIRKVYWKGQLVAVDQKPIYELPQRPKVEVRSSVNIRWLEGNEFEIPVPSPHARRARIIGLVKDQIITKEYIEEVKIVKGKVVSDPKRDILKLAVVERHKASGNIGKGLVKGFGLKRGAIASSVAHDSHNIIVVGVDDEDIFQAVIKINKMGGGLAIAEKGKIVGSLELPIGGLMSDKPLFYVATALEEITARAHSLGVVHEDPFMILSFLALVVVPDLKLTDQGLVSVKKLDFVDLFVE
jgi:adenine deaminase